MTQVGALHSSIVDHCIVTPMTQLQCIRKKIAELKRP
jgi:hypothetical protein